jgi:predicted RNA-binding protein (virulence factor B family)
MVETGKLNKLKVIKKLDFGVYLQGDDLNEILLPRRYVPENCDYDDEIEVFIYLDSEDRIIATTEKPYAMVGDFAALRVVAAGSVGAFVDWGLQKDLLIPFREQKQKMIEGETYVVYVYVDDKTNRIVGSSKLDRFLNTSTGVYQEGQPVDLLICQRTDMGYKAIINNAHLGMLYKGEVFQAFEVGDKTRGFIAKVREDGKIDLILHKPGYEKIDDISKLILDKLKNSGGYIEVTDKSPSEMIYEMFGISKKTFKKAIGALYKERQIKIEEKGIKITS